MTTFIYLAKDDEVQTETRLTRKAEPQTKKPNCYFSQLKREIFAGNSKECQVNEK
jgi:hypothetical protein